MSVDFRACDEKTAQEMRALLDGAVRRTTSTRPRSVGATDGSAAIRRRVILVLFAVAGSRPLLRSAGGDGFAVEESAVAAIPLRLVFSLTIDFLVGLVVAS